MRNEGAFELYGSSCCGEIEKAIDPDGAVSAGLQAWIRLVLYQHGGNNGGTVCGGSRMRCWWLVIVVHLIIPF